MKLYDALRSTNDLKKCSYQMLRRLHKLEYRGSLRTCPKLKNEYFLVLALEHMADTINSCYISVAEAKEAVDNLKELIIVLKTSMSKRERVPRNILVSCLKKHTKVFNWLRNNKIKLQANDDTFSLWTEKCLMAYVSQFGNRI